MVQKITVTLALGALVIGTMLAAKGEAPTLMVGAVFVGLALAVFAAMAFVDRGIKS